MNVDRAMAHDIDGRGVGTIDKASAHGVIGVQASVLREKQCGCGCGRRGEEVGGGVLDK